MLRSERIRNLNGLKSAFVDSNKTDNSSSGDEESEAFFSALMDLNLPDGRPLSYQTAVTGGGGSIVGSYSVNANSTFFTTSALVRQTSSPAGFNIMGEGGKHKVESEAHEGMSTHLNFSSPNMHANQNMAMHNLENGHFINANNNSIGREFGGAFSHDSWNDSSFGNSLKRNRDGKMRVFSDFNGFDNRNTEESSKSSSGLVHHLSLRKSAEAENLLKFQPETVPCQVRAKRGCATHPRSIAERMRRTRISEKMKKLQDLFPNMDKQTSTADMLDLAVAYIKDLQNQVQTLTDKKAKCICSSKPHKE
ncbi:basic helix-loop-helix (bHLH) DNA-bindingsuperfamily protein [Striga asiatica]|uniref:Basic helix-loop-helix (BHLH) DNA-bindingsuperfamily protein n=1 Tax=Striga asiatica TaxID=4170 RepID=A0A5A7R226_STRAF|nr:basic helix-loop-helix (bHLH) DNA-bindingsuperfamily protein [Striga asiatica]